MPHNRILSTRSARLISVLDSRLSLTQPWLASPLLCDTTHPEMSRNWGEIRKHHSRIGSLFRYYSHRGCKHVHEHQDRTDGEDDRPNSKCSAQGKFQVHEEAATPDDPPSDNREDLWDEAYKELKNKKHDLVRGFETIILEESGQAAGARLDDHNLGSVSIRPLLKTVIERKLTEMSDGQLPEPIENTIRIVQGVSDVITLAVKNCSEAALAWSVVTLSLTFLTRPGEVESSHRDGLAYVAARMEYFVAMESEFYKFPPPQQKTVSPSILGLYSDVLEFQLHSVARLYRNRLENLSRDLLNWDKWDEKLASLKKKESKVRDDAETINRNLSRENLSKHHKELDRNFDQLLDFQRKQLEISTEQLITQQRLLYVTENQDQHRLEELETQCLQLFAQVDYEGYKLAVPERIPGTCQWFLGQQRYHKWLQEDSKLLLVSADPGCGKSVLSKFLIDSEFPETGNQICYFFFKDGHTDSTSLKKALCALIHQLLCANPALIRKHAMAPFKKSGQALVESDLALWNLFLDIATDPVCNGVLCVLDALDECSDESLAMLRKLLDHSSARRKESHLRFFMTTRPYENITLEFQDQEDLRIPGEADDLSGKISQDISLVIHERMKSLQKRLDLDTKLTTYLEKRLIEMENRTYLWVHLVFDDLGFETGSYHGKDGASKRADKRFKRTEKGIDNALASIPTSVTEAYEKILSRTPSEDEDNLRKALRIVLAATRPLTVSEMNVAMEISEETKSWNDIDCEDDKQFVQRLKGLGGLFISITGGKIYLIHQTAREFLLPKEGEESSKWCHSITEDEAQTEMRMIVSTYMRVLAEPAEDYSNYNEPKQISEAPSFQLYCVNYCRSRDFDALYLELWDRMIPLLPQEVVNMCTTNILKMKVGKRLSVPVYGVDHWIELYFEDMLSDLAHSDPENPEFPLSDEARPSKYFRLLRIMLDETRAQK
ncbi:hypothetical protein IWZ01DRAFT_528767 [Phyllosticta capitalensis]